MRGLVLVKMSGDPTKFVKQFQKIKGVVDVCPVFGRFDVAVLIEAKDFEALKEIALKVNSTPGIKSTETLPEAP